MTAMIRNQEVPKKKIWRYFRERTPNATWGDLDGRPNKSTKSKFGQSTLLLKEGYRTTYLYPKNLGGKPESNNHAIDFVEKTIHKTLMTFFQREYEKDIATSDQSSPGKREYK